MALTTQLYMILIRSNSDGFQYTLRCVREDITC